MREFELNAGHGTTDYLLYADSKSADVIEPQKRGTTLTGVERQLAPLRKGPASDAAGLVAEHR